MKKGFIIAITLSLCITLCACESKAVKEAKAAYAEGNYEQVVATLSGEEITDEEVSNILFLSEVHVAYSNAEYQKVVDMLADYETDQTELQEMLTVSKANVAFSDKNYYEVVTLLCENESKTECGVYADALTILTEDALNAFDTETIVALYETDESIGETVSEFITDACSAFNYDAFLWLDKLVEMLPDSELKDNLSTYSAENGKTRTKAFMKGEWKIVYDEETQDADIVTLHVHEDDAKCVGFLTQVSEYLEDFYYEPNDLYWQDFIFDGNVPVTVFNLTRYSNGVTNGKISTVELDIEAGKMYIHVTGTTRPDRIYEKVA